MMENKLFVHVKAVFASLELRLQQGQIGTSNAKMKETKQNGN
jgi:hypothetical protein